MGIVACIAKERGRRLLEMPYPNPIRKKGIENSGGMQWG